MIYLQFVHVPEGRTQEHGPFEFVQQTYSILRVGPEGDTILAHREDDLWITPDDAVWTDVIFASEEFK